MTVRHLEFMREAAGGAAQPNGETSNPAQGRQIHFYAAVDVPSRRRTSKYEGTDSRAVGVALRHWPCPSRRLRTRIGNGHRQALRATT